MIRRLGFALAVLALVSGAGLLLRAEPPQAVGTWASIGTAPENRIGAAAVALSDGRTLIVGGLANGTPTDAVVVFDPADSSFATAGQLLEPRAGHTATLLEDGRVLIAGGTVNELLSGDIEIFDPSTGASALVATLAELRSGHAAARFGDGKVLIAGGTGTDGVLQTAEIFDPETGSVSLTGSALNIARTGASATTLIDGRVLIAGGNSGSQDLLTAEIYNPSTDSFQPTDTNLDAPRSNHTAVLLPHNNSVLIVGGTSDGVPLATADLFLPAQFPDPFTYGMGQFALTGEMAGPRSGAAGGPHIEGYAFVVGGGQPDAEVYRFPTIKTDKDDYAPGERAIITGSGWQPEEQVTLLFQEDPAVHADYELTVTADGEGNIYHDQWAPEQHDLNVRFYLLAKQPTAQGDRRAQTTFTDALRVTVSRDNPNGATINNVASGATVTVTFRITNTNTGGEQAIPISGTYSLSFTNLALQSGGPVVSGAFGPLGQNGSTTLTWSFTAPTGPVSGSINLLATITSPACSGAGCSSTTGYTVNVLAPVDSTPPVITPNVVGTVGNNGWYTSDVNVSWTVTDPESAVTSTTGCGPTTINTDTSGTTLTCSATSAGGTASESVTVKRDASNPFNVTGTPNRGPDHNGWYNQAVDVVFQGQDATSGIASCTTVNYGSPDGTALTVPGSCTDNAGNTSAPVNSSAFNFDATDPSNVTGAPNRPPDHDGWYNQAVDVVFQGQDATSGIDSCTTVNYSGPDGTGLTANGSCTDNAGNTSATVASSAFNFDDTDPINVTGAPDRGPDHNGWYNQAVAIVFQGQDATSGINSCITVNYSGPDGTGLTANGSCTDNAGNTSATVASSAFNFDDTDPINVTGAPDRAPDHNGWYNQAVAIVFQGQDATSGINSCITVNYSGPDGTGLTANGSCTDNAGNTSATVASSAFNFDNTAPLITIAAPANGASYVLNSLVASNYSCSDATSGAASCVGPVANGANFDTGMPVNTHNFQVDAADNAGNLASLTSSYLVTYAPAGTACLGSPGRQILQPINVDGNSVFKQKSTVPAKFRVCDANGTSIGPPPNVVLTFKVVNVTGTNPPAVNETVDSTTPDTAFRWSSTDQQWIFNINTRSLNAGYKYWYEIKLNDGGDPILFQFSLK